MAQKVTINQIPNIHKIVAVEGQAVKVISTIAS